MSAVKEQLLTTFGDREWLSVHFTKSQVTNGLVAKALQYNGSQLLSPLAVLEKAQSIVVGHHNTYQTRLDQYRRAVDAVAARLPGMIGVNMEEDANKALLTAIETELAKINPPVNNDTPGPVFFGTWKAVLTESGVVDSRVKDLPSNQALPAITLDAVFGAAQLMARQLDVILQAPVQIPWAGVDMFGAGPWDKLDDVTRSKLDQLIGMDGRPGDYHNFIWLYYYEWGMLLQSVAQWLYLTCEPNKD